MGQYLHSACTVKYFGTKYKLPLVTPYINQKITLICCDAICGHAWKRKQASRRN